MFEINTIIHKKDRRLYEDAKNILEDAGEEDCRKYLHNKGVNDKVADSWIFNYLRKQQINKIFDNC
jgi:hypothetical protein